MEINARAGCLDLSGSEELKKKRKTGSGFDLEDFLAGGRDSLLLGLFGNQGSGHTTQGRARWNKEQAATGTCGLYDADVDWRGGRVFFIKPQLEGFALRQRGQIAGDQKQSQVVLPENPGGG